MTPRELAAYRAGLRQAAEWALVAALSLELRDDAGELRQQAAVAALRGLAEGLKADTTHQPAGVPHHADAQHA
ncbi:MULTISPECIES: hypothetical protein [Methylorubrum]|uniref:hypothetical protein n=1 Tax=Methylorubrum TaxID=2282523 RepID=UPI00209D9987|nr:MULTISPECIES: hypothetical protein [Methylorubrum]MCP1551649.1 hypothetical protein [Methylorubrum zatmanii]MCP1556616.1 hypothetical protein [Methylorubrum extorquens]MCP1581984.1 hypothetical protein [Methylorubrum extorquens]